MIRIALLALACAFFISPAEARQRHHATGMHESCNILWPCQAPISAAAVRENQRVARGEYVARQMGIGGVAPRRVRTPAVHRIPVPAPRKIIIAERTSTTIVAHPEGCPRSEFCGCGAAVRVFGHAVRELWLAANWFKFPRTSPAPGMAAVRRHHVFVLEADLGGGLWKVYDANSGHHLTRVHARSLAGYAIVNPRA